MITRIGGSGRKVLLRCFSTSLLPGGFSSDGLREWACLNNFGADDHSTITGQEMRRRRRKVADDESKLPYVDLFSTKISDSTSKHLIAHQSPSDLLGRAFFSSKSFMGERILLSSLNTLFSLYSSEATTIPTEFKPNTQYLNWTVSSSSSLELICVYNIERLNVRGCTMMAFDPSLRKVYHGNCIDIAEGRIQGYIPEAGIQLHCKYAQLLLDGMADELEQIANKQK